MTYGTDNGPLCPRCRMGGIYTYQQVRTEEVYAVWFRWFRSKCHVCNDTQEFISGTTGERPTIQALKLAHDSHLSRNPGLYELPTIAGVTA